MREKQPRVTIHPTVSITTIIVLELYSRKENISMGKAVEKLLEESKTFKKIKEELKN